MKAPTQQQLNDPEWWFCYLSERYEYNTLTGEVRNKSGRVITTKNAGGYIRINCRINYKRYDLLAHRVAFMLVMGRWPEMIDHINGVTADNRWANLREVGAFENMQNMKLRSSNKTGVIGVHVRSGGLYRAAIGSGKSRENLGSFADFFEAVCARKSAELTLGYHANHGRPGPIQEAA